MEEQEWDLSDEPTKVECPEGCGKTITKNRDGSVRKHKCVGDESTVREVSAGRPKAVRRTKGQAPAKVRQLGVATLAAGIEWGSEKFVEKATGQPVPILADSGDEVRKLTDLPDADGMIGPFINLLWPQLPPGIQKTIAAFAEHEDVIAAIFAWLEWAQQIKRYTDAVVEQQDKAKEREQAQHEPSQQVYPTSAGEFEIGEFASRTVTYPSEAMPGY